jgi:hypothetical protein
MHLHQLTLPQRQSLLEKVLELFRLFCLQEFQTHLYPYQLKVARALLSSVLVERKTVFVKIARQAGKTEVLTLLLRFLVLYYRHFLNQPLMAAIASPHGEQAKTDIDRLKQSLQKLRERWQVEDRENNQSTIRAYRQGLLMSEMFKFSLAPTTHNESKTLNVLAIEESHKADHQKRSDELDPMLASTNGVTWHFGVGCTVLSDYKRGCDGDLPDSIAIVVDAEEVCRDRRIVFQQTGDPSHLAYEHAFQAELRAKGRNNPEIKRNYYLEDMIEEGNFISRERFLSLARAKPCCADQFYLGIDWARTSDWTWAALVNAENDLVNVWKYPHVPYEEQIGLILEDLKPYQSGIVSVRVDATSANMQSEYLMQKGFLPMGEESLYAFTQKSKNDLYTTFEGALFRDPGDPLRFSYPAWHPLASEVEEQMTQLIREYKSEGEFLSPHAPEVPGAHDDAPTAIALAIMAASTGFVGEILFG